LDRCNLKCTNFFFQAEDGIRDFHVTGVQTCALPIWRGQADRLHGPGPRAIIPLLSRPDCLHGTAADTTRGEVPRPATGAEPARRSEERRVGKGGRTRRSPDPDKNKETGASETGEQFK